MSIMSFTTISIMISVSLMFLISMLKTKKQQNNQQENINFECGFNQKMSSMMPFSSQFFLIAILFLIFDLEISLFLPILMNEQKNISSSLTSSMMMLILSMGLMSEWSKNMIEWSK